MQKIHIGLGGNLNSSYGTPEKTLRAAINQLSGLAIDIQAISKFYCTSPVPASDQPDFINAVIFAQSSLSAELLLSHFKGIESFLGREPSERWSARTIDIDLLSYGAEVLPSVEDWWSVVNSSDPAAILQQPVVPHPRMHKRAFVLVPMLDIASDWVHPVTGKSVADMAIEPEIMADRIGVRPFSG
ncbi:2-amino-4-hydroxy-6-hydroxymethyldihydropteridine diphosphokinase [Kordiimonas pumila]|uniref:2-amino-4-hydroxy-6-hydroxymethyldihydropteridine pyrophosphokinase n=1 Tax=Kordiimonas pumila TaxID=2161677 RepID=A0ABV7D0T3_9PROT|nr:2-amino-4-hydroxy-6-hydroxymethyldihydropteridine diphosphokinase [Kordiimonas pumila]